MGQTIQIQADYYNIEAIEKKDTGVANMLQYFKDSLERVMKKVIGFSVNGMYRKQPEGNLGNFLADCMMIMGQKKYHCKIDASFINAGGFKGIIHKGDITVGSIYELMPYDNTIVLVKLTGGQLATLLDKIAEDGGWPLAGLTMGIKYRTAMNIMVNGSPLNEFTEYTIATTDYLANGGDKCTMLKPLQKENIGYQLRDAIIDYIELLTEQGKPIDATIEKRILYAN